ncbi:MAG: SRPBCC family protein [Paracoccus sp. (in: a-proteobacteria)]|uniref:SRPBCC family protein n=1 Tax=Paracoccus sp. TaxID=267 RepID=UPI0026DEE04F|nr:SRPBCC family protein [Paracoccus sp. (in: a-proteobacteria)]MDO5631884.1 SRPBCC family protein [Paracoccus sp. (in: a-proteobacteria)]
MTRLFAAALAGAMLVVSVAQAHGPVRLRTEHSVVLNATPDEVWQAIGQFDDMGWHPAIASTEITGDGSVDVPEVSTRVLHLKADSGDPTITEKLIGHDPAKRSYKYMIESVDVAVLPVTNYSATLQVKDKDGKAEVVWKAGFYRGYPNNDPPPDLNDDTAQAAVDAIYQAGMEALAERFGTAE